MDSFQYLSSRHVAHNDFNYFFLISIDPTTLKTIEKADGKEKGEGNFAPLDFLYFEKLAEKSALEDKALATPLSEKEAQQNQDSDHPHGLEEKSSVVLLVPELHSQNSGSYSNIFSEAAPGLGFDSTFLKVAYAIERIRDFNYTDAFLLTPKRTFSDQDRLLAPLNFETQQIQGNNTGNSFAYQGIQGLTSLTVFLASASAAANAAAATSNSSPVVSSSRVTVFEDSQNNALNIAPPTDANGDLLSIRVTGLPDAAHGIVTLSDGAAVTIGQTLTTAQLQGLQYDTALNVNGSSGTFTYAVSDGINAPVPGAVTLNITPVNDAPRIALADNQFYNVTEQSLAFYDNFRPNAPIISPIYSSAPTNRADAAASNAYSSNMIFQENRSASIEFTSKGSNITDQSTLGWYKIDPTTGTISDINILWSNLSQTTNGTVGNLGTINKGEEIGFFLINNGNFFNNWLDPSRSNYIDLNHGRLFFGATPGGTAATIFSTAPQLWYIPDGNPREAFTVHSASTGIWHSDANQTLGTVNLNNDGLIHSAALADQSTGFLKLDFSGNKVSQDYLFNVDLGTTSTRHDYFSGNQHIIVGDIDNTNLSGATVHLTTLANVMAPQYDKIGMTGFELSDSSIVGTHITILGLGTKDVILSGTDTTANYESVLSSLRLYRSDSNDYASPNVTSTSTTANPGLYLFSPGDRQFDFNVTDGSGTTSNTISHIVTVHGLIGLGDNNNNNIQSSPNGQQALFGQSGNDVLYQDKSGVSEGGLGNDTLIGTVGYFGATGGAGNDTLTGGAGTNYLYGGRGDDIINSGAGTGFIAGNQGNDIINLSGANLHSLFYFKSDVGNGVDTVTGFNTAQDTINLIDVLDAYQNGPLDLWLQAKQTAPNVVTLSIDVDGLGNSASFVPLATLNGAGLSTTSMVHIEYAGGMSNVPVVP